MTRTLKHALLAATLLGGVAISGLPAEAMPVGNLAPVSASADPTLAGQIQQARWVWHRHWHRRGGWHRHWRWHHRRW